MGDGEKEVRMSSSSWKDVDVLLEMPAVLVFSPNDPHSAAVRAQELVSLLEGSRDPVRWIELTTSAEGNLTSLTASGNSSSNRSSNNTVRRFASAGEGTIRVVWPTSSAGFTGGGSGGGSTSSASADQTINAAIQWIISTARQKQLLHHIMGQSREPNGDRATSSAAEQSASSAKYGKRRCIVLENVCALNCLHQAALRKIIEDTSASAIFILTCSNINAVDPAIKSRSTLLRTAPMSLYGDLQSLALSPSDGPMISFASGAPVSQDGTLAPPDAGGGASISTSVTLWMDAVFELADVVVELANATAGTTSGGDAALQDEKVDNKKKRDSKKAQAKKVRDAAEKKVKLASAAVVDVFKETVISQANTQPSSDRMSSALRTTAKAWILHPRFQELQAQARVASQIGNGIAVISTLETRCTRICRKQQENDARRTDHSSSASASASYLQMVTYSNTFVDTSVNLLLQELGALLLAHS